LYCACLLAPFGKAQKGLQRLCVKGFAACVKRFAAACGGMQLECMYGRKLVLMDD
jgi:hypothetical protein